MTPARKIGGALGAGCSLIIKPSEETPGTCVELVRAFHEAGLPKGVLNLVFGVPARISEHLIASDDHPQGLVHRLGAGRQASDQARRRGHEAHARWNSAAIRR